jgi:hypothetical protein
MMFDREFAASFAFYGKAHPRVPCLCDELKQ